MPNPTQTTLAQLREQIKREAKISGSNNLDTYIDELINELLVQYAWKHRYFELLVMNHEIATVADTATYTLPTNFMVLRLVRYRFSNSSYRTLSELGDYTPNPPSGSPRYYALAGDSLNLSPSTNIVTDDTLVIDYYKIPETLEADDVFPIPRIWTPLKQEAIARAHTYNNQLKQAVALGTSGQRIESKAEGSR